VEEFLGVLFCGGRGTRLGEVTKYISKSFIPIYNRPVFKFGLEILNKSKFVNEIIILTNDDNNARLSLLGYQTIIQDDSLVFDMFSGWDFIKKKTGTKKNGVLVPSDNITDVNIDNMISKFNREKCNLVFSLFEVNDRNKLSQMGCYNPDTKEFFYKHQNPPTKYGVIAPYIVKNNFDTLKGDKVLNDRNIETLEHKGFWFDVGDYESIIEAGNYIYNLRSK
jgi:dTDP-glucose pyrophosphorylase